MKSLLVTLFVLIVCSIGYALDGQVFIVTNGGTNIKLGLVVVSIYTRADVEKYISVRKMVVLPKLKRLMFERDNLAKAGQYSKARAKGEDCLLLFHTFFDEIGKLTPLASTKSDAEGKFSLNTPARTDVVLFAKSSRSANGDIESYTWILPPDEWGSPLFLSNDNLFQISMSSKPQSLTGKK